MPWHRFKAGPAEVRHVLSFVFGETDCVVFETYSEIDRELRTFTALTDVEAAFDLGVAARGSAPAQQLSLWSPSVMPRPAITTIALKKPPGKIRQTVDGCGLFQLHFGGERSGEITESQLGYWTEAGARERCLVVPGPDSVNWVAHRALAGKLKYHVTKRIKVR